MLSKIGIVCPRLSESFFNFQSEYVPEGFLNAVKKMVI